MADLPDPCCLKEIARFYRISYTSAKRDMKRCGAPSPIRAIGQPRWRARRVMQFYSGRGEVADVQ